MTEKLIRIFEVTTETSKQGEVAFVYRKAAATAEEAIKRVKDEEFVDTCEETILGVKQIAMEA